MPEVPQRPPSYGENLDKQRKLAKRKPSTYQGVKSTPTYTDSRSKHGFISTSLPHPFQCSKCEYIGVSKSDFNNHWVLNH